MQQTDSLDPGLLQALAQQQQAGGAQGGSEAFHQMVDAIAQLDPAVAQLQAQMDQLRQQAQQQEQSGDEQDAAATHQQMHQLGQ